MAKERASIKGGEVINVKVGKVWTVIKLKIPTASLVNRGLEQKPTRPAKASKPAKKAWKTIRAKKKAAVENAAPVQ